MKKYRVTLDVIVNENSVIYESLGAGTEAQIVQCTGCGDCYDNTLEFMEHQFTRDLQFMDVVPGSLTVEKL